MPVSLTHLGESIFTEMVNRKPAPFLARIGVHEAGLASPIAFREVVLEPYLGRRFDGAARVDTVVAISDAQAIPFELKLGHNRLTSSRIDTEWLRPCKTSHGDQRWAGNMMAILERKFPDAANDAELAVTIERPLPPRRFVLTSDWFVVARRRTLQRWSREPPAFSERVRLLAFEDVIDDFGGRTAFNDLLREILTFDFYEAWFASDGNEAS